VQDDGPGIPAEHIERIFDPFFTTRPAGAGLGLGLAHAHHIVRRHGGEIHVASQPGAGTTFEVRLPAGDAGASRRAAA
jgi:signal transduction histidine kinase